MLCFTEGRLGQQPVFNLQVWDAGEMCGVVSDEDHVMDQGNSSDEQISIFNQLTPHAQHCVELGGPVEDGVIDHDNTKHPP